LCSNSGFAHPLPLFLSRHIFLAVPDLLLKAATAVLPVLLSMPASLPQSSMSSRFLFLHELMVSHRIHHDQFVVD
jgi:hypothetical protein